MVDRLLGALKGDVATFEEVEHDESATIQAALIVVVASLLTGLATVFANDTLDNDVSTSRGFLTGVIGSLLAWLVWSALTHFIGSRFFGATSSLGEMLRVIGFAHVPLFLIFIPFVGLLATFWFLFVAFKAIRAGLDISTGKTVLVILIGLVLRIIINLIAGI